MTDILAEINDIVAFASIFDDFGERFAIVSYATFQPVVAQFVEFFDVDSPAATVSAEALIAVNTEINMIKVIATAKLSVGKVCEGFVLNDDLETFIKDFTCICVETFELTLDATGYGTCACSDGFKNVDGVCVEARVED